MDMKVIVTEYRGSGFYGNRPRKIMDAENVRPADAFASDVPGRKPVPIPMDELYANPKRKRRRSCAR